jgi:cysteine-rich repeat protein
LYVFDSAGTRIDSFMLSDVSNGANQATILIATDEATAFFNVDADLAMTAVIPPRGGKICFDATSIDCMSWGNYTGSTAGVGTPFNQCGGLEPGQAARRRLDICGSATLLEFCDDANNSSTDFVVATPAPRNNLNVTGTIPPSTCGNGTLEGLEQCDDNNTNDGDGCSSSCQLEPPFCANEKGDLNGMGGLSPADAVIMLNCVFLDPTGCGLCYTDVNSDDSLTPSDAVAELNAVFLGTPFPC